MQVPRSIPASAACLLVLIVCSLTIAAIPGADNPKATTDHDLLKAALGFNRRTLSEPYQQIGRRDPKWDADATAFLQGMAIRYASAMAQDPLYDLPDKPDAKAMIQLAEKVLAKGCDDPMVRYCYATLLIDSGRRNEGSAIITDACKALMESHYPITRAMHAALREFHTEVTAGGEPATHDPAWEKFRDSVLAMTRSFPFKDLDRRIIYLQLESLWKSVPLFRLNDLADNLRNVKDADPWLLDMLDGRRQVEAAWGARSSETADKVTAAGWKGFAEHLAIARDCFNRAHALHPDYPEAATAMIPVAMGREDPNDDPRQWFDHAMEAQFDFDPAFHGYLWSIYPRWGGSIAAMHQFGLECLETKRFDTRVPWEYAVVLESIAFDQGGPDFWQQPGVFDNVKTMCEGYVAAVKDAKLRASYASYEAAAAWRCGHYDVAVQQLDKLGTDVDSGPFTRLKVVPALAMSHAHAMVSDGDAVNAAENLAAGEQLDAAVTSYKQLLAKHDKDACGLFIRSRLKQLGWQKQFEAGDWISIQPEDEELAGWGQLGGKWRRNGDALIADTSGGGSHLAFEGLFAGKRFEVEATIETPTKTTQYTCGITLSSAQPFSPIGFWMRIGPHEQFLMDDFNPNTRKPFESGKTNDIRLALFDDLIQVSVNGQMLWNNHAPGWFDHPRLYVGLGCRTDPPDAEVKFTKLRMRKLTEPPSGH